jgi:hypothetical protein
LRIGSDPSADIRIPTANLAPHAMTLEFRDGHYRIHNRADETILVGRNQVEPQTAQIWKEGSELQVADTRLLLEADGDPAPVRAPKNASATDYETVDEAADVLDECDQDSDESKTKPNAKSKQLTQLCLILVCGLAGVLLFVGGDNAAPAASSPVDFDTVVREARAADDVPDSLVRELQYAEQSFVRCGATKAVVARFQRLRDRLVGFQATMESDDDGGVEEILRFVQFRLDQIRSLV